MSTRQAAWSGSEAERRKLTGWFGLFAALGWVVLELFFELLLGPHVRLVRSMAIGSGIGAGVGLLVSTLQWLALRGYVLETGRLIPVTTAASTLSGLAAGLLVYSLNHNLELYGSNLPLQGVTGAVIVGLAIALAQWVVLSDRLGQRREWSGWAANSVAGCVLGAACALVSAATVINVLGPVVERRLWPYMLIVATLAASAVGGAVYGRFTTDGLRRALWGSAGRAEPGSAEEDVELEGPRTAGSARPGSYAQS